MSNVYYTEAGYFKRFMAFLLDCFLVMLLPTVLYAYSFPANKTAFIIGIVTIQIAGRLYFILMYKFFGTTLGKKIFKLKVINFHCEDISEKLSWKAVLLRQLLDIITLAPQIIIPVISLILYDTWEGYITYQMALNYYQVSLIGRLFACLSGIYSIASLIIMIVNDENRTLDDLIAGTVVIEE